MGDSVAEGLGRHQPRSPKSVVVRGDRGAGGGDVVLQGAVGHQTCVGGAQGMRKRRGRRMSDAVAILSLVESIFKIS